MVFNFKFKVAQNIQKYKTVKISESQNTHRIENIFELNGHEIDNLRKLYFVFFFFRTIASWKLSSHSVLSADNDKTHVQTYFE